MKAVQYRAIGAEPEVVEIETPKPGPGEVLLKVTAAGLCHSDIAVMSLPKEKFTYELPMTLGHEGVGTVVEYGPGADGFVEIGESVMVYGPWGCGRCRQCAEGYENYCLNAAALNILPPGLGAPGAAAEYLIVDSPRHLVPIGDLDPVTTAPLTDAGLTPYHAIKASLPWLGANSVVAVFGVGGLGHIGIQLLRHLTGARVIALDVGQDKLDLAMQVGAHDAFESNDAAVASIRALTKGRGVDAVFDFVGVQPSVNLAAKLLANRSMWMLVGIGGGVASGGFGAVPFEAHIVTPFWGTRADLLDVVALAKQGVFDIHIERYTLDQAPEAYRRLHDGKVIGRAVIVP